MATRKANGQGHTYKVGGSYKTVIRHKGNVVTATAKTAQESKRLAKERVSQVPAYGLQKVLPKQRRRTNEFILEWLESEHQHQIAHSTYLRYRGLLIHHINPLLGEYLVKELTPKIITWFLVQMKESGQSPRSQQQARTLLSVALRAAEDQGLILDNPVRKVRNPQNRPKHIEPLTVHQVKKMLSTYEGTPLAARLHIALLCGLRQGEALGLEWGDIDFANQSLTVTKQFQKINNNYIQIPLKTFRSHRTVIFSVNTSLALQKHKEIIEQWKVSNPNWVPNNLVFPNRNGLPLGQRADYSDWQKCLINCNIPLKRLHDARHTAATLMYSQGVGIETISRALGHSSSSITSKLYVHNAEAPLRSAAEKLSELLYVNTSQEVSGDEDKFD